MEKRRLSFLFLVGILFSIITQTTTLGISLPQEESEMKINVYRNLNYLSYTYLKFTIDLETHEYIDWYFNCTNLNVGLTAYIMTEINYIRWLAENPSNEKTVLVEGESGSSGRFHFSESDSWYFVLLNNDPIEESTGVNFGGVLGEFNEWSVIAGVLSGFGCLVLIIGSIFLTHQKRKLKWPFKPTKEDIEIMKTLTLYKESNDVENKARLAKTIFSKENRNIITAIREICSISDSEEVIFEGIETLKEINTLYSIKVLLTIISSIINEKLKQRSILLLKSVTRRKIPVNCLLFKILRHDSREGVQKAVIITLGYLKPVFARGKIKKLINKTQNSDVKEAAQISIGLMDNKRIKNSFQYKKLDNDLYVNSVLKEIKTTTGQTKKRNKKTKRTKLIQRNQERRKTKPIITAFYGLISAILVYVLPFNIITNESEYYILKINLACFWIAEPTGPYLGDSLLIGGQNLFLALGYLAPTIISSIMNTGLALIAIASIYWLITKTKNEYDPITHHKLPGKITPMLLFVGNSLMASSIIYFRIFFGKLSQETVEFQNNRFTASLWIFLVIYSINAFLFLKMYTRKRERKVEKVIKQFTTVNVLKRIEKSKADIKEKASKKSKAEKIAVVKQLLERRGSEVNISWLETITGFEEEELVEIVKEELGLSVIDGKILRRKRNLPENSM